MPKNAVTDWSQTASQNSDIAGIDISEGCPPSGINDAIRTLMSQIATWVSTTIASLMPKSGGTFTGDVSFSNANTGERKLVFPVNTRLSYFYANGFSFGAYDNLFGNIWSLDYALNKVIIGSASFTSTASFTGATSFTGSVTLSGGVLGPTTFASSIGAASLSTTGALGVGGAATFSGPASFPAGVTGPVTFGSSIGAASLSTSGAAGIGTTLTVGGNSSLQGVSAASVRFNGSGNPTLVPSGSALLIQIAGVTVAYFDATGVHNGAP